MPDWERLAEHIRNRRAELGYPKRPAFADASHISLRTLSSIETAARTNYDRNTINALETALRWAPGSIRTILNGGNPTPANPGHITATLPTLTANATATTSNTLADDPVMRILASPAPADVKQQIVARLLAEQRQFAQRRVDELLREALADQPTPPAG